MSPHTRELLLQLFVAVVGGLLLLALTIAAAGGITWSLLELSRSITN